MSSHYLDSARPDEALEASQRFFNRGPDFKYYLEKRMVKEAAPLIEQEYQKDPGSPWIFGTSDIVTGFAGETPGG